MSVDILPSVRVWEYLDEYEAEKASIHQAIEKVLSSGQLVLGPSVEQFEVEFAAYCGVRHGVGVDNGTNAITLGLKAIGVKPGDEVITVANTAVPTVSAIVTLGAIPRFVDIDPTTFLMDTRQLPSAISAKTACILPVHLYGQCVEMDSVREIAGHHGLAVLEDCAQAHGAKYKGAVAGSLSAAASFSFYPTKILGGYGDGGMVITDEDSTEQQLRRLRFYGMENRYYADQHGYNSRLDELHAEILRFKLTQLDNYLGRRKQIARSYDEALADTDLTLPATAAGNEHAYYVYVVRHPRRDEIMARLRQCGIGTNISYPWPIHTMTGYDWLGYRDGDLPHTESAAAEIFSLPMFPALDNERQQAVCDALHDILQSL